VTYPDPKVAEVLDKFVCIRVDVDQEPDVAKKHRAKALPDLRLLDADGRELRQLLGFSSPERLAKACAAALDVLAGKPVDDSRPKSGPRIVAVTEPAIRTGVAQGCAWLEREGAKSLGHDGGVAGLGDAVLLALVAAGRSDSEAVRTMLRANLAAPLSSTYQVAFHAMALARLDAKAHTPRLAECQQFLAGSQLADGSWSYGNDPKATGDRSNSAYALLGVDACARAGVEVAPELVQKAERAWRRAQNADGGFGYRSDREVESYASMTESALGSLVLCRRLLHRPAAEDQAIARGCAWLAAHAAVEQNLGSSYQQGRLLYHLYALERAGTLLSTDRFGDFDWYARGAAFLLGTQRDDGSWDDGADMPAANTAFAILFLTRATKLP
jgi:hypothetical protein